MPESVSDRKSPYQKITARHGFDVTPFESFRAQVGIMMSVSNFKERAQSLWDNYHKAKNEAERQEIMDEAGGLIVECRKAMYGAGVVNKLGAPNKY